MIIQRNKPREALILGEKAFGSLEGGIYVYTHDTYETA